ncbi:hypothetical protein BPO_1390 [Bergeyella porcorum]|uniref:Uncharacterized protein n=1 Tax=Bergeyella porcorum TaxID=1735111 RepID=A0AAU0F1I1_9FLAO
MEYLNTKRNSSIDLPETAIAITNIDDKNGLVMLQNTKATKKNYAQKTLADYHGNFWKWISMECFSISMEKRFGQRLRGSSMFIICF